MGIGEGAGLPHPLDCNLGVAQICNLPYRGIVFRNCPLGRQPVDIRRFADCKSAIQQITNLRYTADGSQPSALTLLKTEIRPASIVLVNSCLGDPPQICLSNSSGAWSEKLRTL